MWQGVRELSAHFRANPLSWLVAVLLALLLGVVAFFLFHMNVAMQRASMEHDQRQHLQLTGQLIEQRLQLALAELRALAAANREDLRRGRALLVAERLRAMCDQYGDLAGFRVRAAGQPSPFDIGCDGASFGQLPAHLDGDDLTSVQRASARGSLLEDQLMVIQWQVRDERGGLESVWQLLYSLGSIRHDATPAHGVPVKTRLVVDAADWIDISAAEELVAARGVWVQAGRDGTAENSDGFFIARDVTLRDPSDQSSVATWRLIAHVPHTVLAQYYLAFFRDMGLTFAVFALVLAALFFYSRRIIGEQARMVEELRHKQMFLDRLLDSSPDAMLTVGLDGAILSYNSRAETLFAYRPGELVSRSVELLLPSDYQLSDQDYSAIYEGLANEALEFRRGELVGIRSQGDDFPVEVTYCRLKMPDQPRLLLIIREVTERKVAERELDSLRVQYFQQEKMAQIGLLMAGILHEVGNPLAAIEGLLQEILYLDAELESPRLNEHYRKNLDMVLEQAARIRGICHDVSGFASPRQSARGPLSLNQILQGTGALLSYDKRWRRIELVLDLDPLLPAMNGIADQLTQVFMNLLVNAADAFEDAPPADARVRVGTRQVGSDIIQVEIADNGSGIADAAMSHIFDSFYTTKPKGKGTGLGLSICERLIEEHGGGIEIESRQGEGTSVRIYFPIEAPLTDG